MSTTTPQQTTTPSGLDARILSEGYGPGAWHGPDLKAAMTGVDEELAFWRPGADRHSIAEIALHHAYHVHQVRSRLTGEAPSPFLLAGDDWFALPDASKLTWAQLAKAVETEQRKLMAMLCALEHRFHVKGGVLS